MKVYKISVLGPQGSGKGTQSALLTSKLNIPAISMGQLFRDEVEQKGKYADEVEKIMNKGEMVPERISKVLLVNRLSRDDVKNGYIIDGFPRNMEQYEYFHRDIDEFTHVIVINLSDEKAIERISGRRICSECGKVYHMVYYPPQYDEICDECGKKLEIRDDDKPEVIKRRLEVYHTYTEPVIEKYREEGILYEVDGDQSIEDVHRDIMKIFTD